MSRRDYEAIAKAIKASRSQSECSDERAAVDHTTRAVADALASLPGNFNRGLFLDACKPEWSNDGA